jgi:hypothetical protein
MLTYASCKQCKHTRCVAHDLIAEQGWHLMCCSHALAALIFPNQLCGRTSPAGHEPPGSSNTSTCTHLHCCRPSLFPLPPPPAAWTQVPGTRLTTDKRDHNMKHIRIEVGGAGGGGGLWCVDTVCVCVWGGGVLLHGGTFGSWGVTCGAGGFGSCVTQSSVVGKCVGWSLRPYAVSDIPISISSTQHQWADVTIPTLNLQPTIHTTTDTSHLCQHRHTRRASRWSL